MSVTNIASTRKVGQIRFYNSSNPNNYHPKTNKSNNEGDNTNQFDMRNLISGSAFSGYNIIQLGIQGLPGTKFYINESIGPVILGYTGIYELDVDGISTITSLKFDKKSIETINNNPNAHLIIDFIYESGGNS